MRNAHLLVCRAQAGLGIPMCCALPGLTHLAFHGRHEPRKIAFHEVVVRAALHDTNCHVFPYPA